MAGTRNVLDITILYVYNKHTKKKKFKKRKKIMLFWMVFAIGNEYEILTTFANAFVEFFFSLEQVVEILVQ